MTSKAGDQRTEEMLCEAERQGFRVQKTKRGHFKVWGPDGTFVTTIAGTPSDHRAHLNALAYLKRGGYVPPKK